MARATTRAAAARQAITFPRSSAWAHAVPTTTGTTAAGRVRGRAPATQRFTARYVTGGARAGRSPRPARPGMGGGAATLVGPGGRGAADRRPAATAGGDRPPRRAPADAARPSAR